jgi:adenosylcobinamide-GDP ribazoletransferase
MTPFWEDLLDCLRFWSRLPVRDRVPVNAQPDFGRIVSMLPLAGLVIAAPSAVALCGAHILALPALVAGGLAIACLCIVTGALHEDGFADTADGFFGGADSERRLSIMRDSRIGSFGAIALVLSLGLRTAALAVLYQKSASLAAAGLLSGAAISRTAGLLPLILLPPARADGAGRMAARPMTETAQTAVIIAGLLALLPVMAGVAFGRALLAGLAAAAAAYALVPLARAKIGGQTGDVAGAAQQMAEIAFLCVLSGGA